MRLNISILLLTVIFSSCINENNKLYTKQLRTHDVLLNVSDSIIDISTDILFNFIDLNIYDDFLIVTDIHGVSDRAIHLFNRKTFVYVASAGILGRGPGEIARPGGEIGYDKLDKKIWLSDHGNMVIWEFPIDSILHNSYFKPTNKLDISSELFVLDFYYINDSIALGKGIIPLNHFSFEMATVSFNVNSNSIDKYGYEYPYATGSKLSNSYYNVSNHNNIYVNCHHHIDLLTICDLNGNLICNVFGPGWKINKKGKKVFYFDVNFFKSYILASYLGEDEYITQDTGRPKVNYPSKIIVLDSNGDYKTTIETGYCFSTFCIDEDSGRVILYFEDRDTPLGYFYINQYLS